jgi:beta-glucosidase
MAGHTYRFLAGTPLHPFGHGLSSTTFGYAKLRTSAATLTAHDSVPVSVDVKNTGMPPRRAR